MLQPRGWPLGLQEGWGPAFWKSTKATARGGPRASSQKGLQQALGPRAKSASGRLSAPTPGSSGEGGSHIRKAPVAIPGRQPNHQAEVRPRSRPALQGWRHGQPHVPRGLQAPGPAGISPRSPGGSETPPQANGRCPSCQLRAHHGAQPIQHRPGRGALRTSCRASRSSTRSFDGPFASTLKKGD